MGAMRQSAGVKTDSLPTNVSRKAEDQCTLPSSVFCGSIEQVDGNQALGSAVECSTVCDVHVCEHRTPTEY